MKRILLFLFLFVCMAVPTMAQQWTDVVYLKNGSIIRGVVIEHIPGESLKIQTSDGSLFVYSMNEVEKITKEQVSSTSSSPINIGGGSLTDEILDGKLEFGSGKVWVNGTQLNEKTTIALLGAARYNEVNRYSTHWTGGSLIASMGSVLVSVGLFMELRQTDSQIRKTVGHVSTGVGLASCITGLIMMAVNGKRANRVLEEYNRMNGYAFGNTAPVAPVSLGTQAPQLMEYTPVFAFTKTF